MYALLLATGIASALIWIVLVFFRGGFWRNFGGPFKPGVGLSGTEFCRPVPQVREANLGISNDAHKYRIAAIIPARNEADVIGRAIASLLQQNVEAELHIFLVDDGSTDGTADRAREAASALGHIDRLTILRASPLPPGWSGKLWAVRAGIEHALSAAPKPKSGLNGPPDYLLLTDADIEHSPGNLATLIAIAENGVPRQSKEACLGHRYDLVSFMVKLHCASFAERLLIPAFVYFFFKLYPPRWIADPRHRIAGAAGGCMLVRPDALARAGGIEAIRSEIIDDCALAARIKRSGGRVWLSLPPLSPLKPSSGLNGPPLTASIRPYRSFAAIEQMIARTAFNQLRHSALLLLGCILGLALTYIAPVALLFCGQLVPAVLGAIALLLMTASYVPMVRFYDRNPLWAFTLPAAALFYMIATIHSALNYWSGRGGQWKGRAQDTSASPESSDTPMCTRG